MLTRRVTFRLYPSKSQEAKLFEARRLHAYLYNACIEQRKTSYRKFGKSVDYFTQQAAIVPFKECWPEYKSLNHGSLQATVKRVDFAFQRFFKGLGGSPRFQSLRRYSGWTYPDARQGFKVLSSGKNGYLELRDLKLRIQMRGKARTWGNPTTCTIVYRTGKWYASITVNCEPNRETGTGAVGIDFGVLTAIALSDGTKIKNPRFLSKTLGKIRKASKSTRRKRGPAHKKKVKPSNRWRKARKRVSRLQQKVANQRKDWSHKVAAEIVSVNSLVATEKLEIQKITRQSPKGKRKAQKTGLNRSILDVGIGMIRAAIEYKLIEACGWFVEVPTLKVKPSQTCPACGHQEKKTLAERVHCCLPCGYTDDRDVAAAKVCLNWARGMERASLSVDGSSSTDCGSMKQLARMKRQKPHPQRSGVG